MRYPGVDPDWRNPEPASSRPTVPLGLVHDGAVVRYFSLVCSVGTPQTILAQELRIECMFPADAKSEALHHALIA